MKTSYQCSKGHINRIRRPKEGFPDSVKCFECDEIAYRVFGQFGTQIAEGTHGNSETGYNKIHGYQPAKSTPLNFLYGDAGRFNTQFDDGD